MSRPLDTFTARGRLKDGKLIMDSDKYFRGMLFNFEDCPVRVIVERIRKEHSKQQRGYYRAVVLPMIAEYVGETPERLHTIFKEKYLREKVLWRGGEMYVPRSTEELSSNEYAEYLTNVLLEAADLGIVIPEPDKTHNLD